MKLTIIIVFFSFPFPGILRCAAFSGSRNICLYDPNLDPIHNMTKKEYEEQTNTKNGSAMNHFHGK